ncbi:TadG family pilus assembly protein [Cupriavidus basilensis]|uniref:TadG family pilus assembly protein n=1 Tax=Cupriavidus basilensis TaxID=68895 RepID=UPI0020A6CC20|nr:TadG family pilus assembly protein [Cupriavidus basilensis]MCP3023398.1 pilus assembly protein TadG-related protein [Cupriavidus basilensis]
MKSDGNRINTDCQRGSVGVMTPFLMIFMLAFAALTIDIARVLIVRNELQNAADAAALVGASGLYPANPNPNWSNGISQGSSAVTLNATENVKLITGQAQAGYWNLQTRGQTGLKPQDITPGTNDVAAVQVTINRSSTDNNGPVSLLLAPIFGMRGGALQASAVAVIAGAGNVGAGVLFPMAINSCMYDLYWNKTTGQPVVDSSGNPIVIDIDTSYPVPARTCLSAEWASFNSSGQTNASTSASAIKNLITGGNANPVSIGNSTTVNISNGVDASVYNTFTNTYPNLPVIVYIPVVSNVTPGSNNVPVVAFAAFQITKVNKNGSHSYIEGNFVANQRIPGAGGVGPYYGAYVPPRLAW